MQASRRHRFEFWVPAALSWSASSVVALVTTLGQGQDSTWRWPATLTAAWALVGVALAIITPYRRVGLGLLVGLVLGIATAAVLLFLVLSVLASEIGYS